jgi:hypothetical protein
VCPRPTGRRAAIENGALQIGVGENTQAAVGPVTSTFFTRCSCSRRTTVMMSVSAVTMGAGRRKACSTRHGERLQLMLPCPACQGTELLAQVGKQQAPKVVLQAMSSFTVSRASW